MHEQFFTKKLDDHTVLPVAVRYSYDILAGHSRDTASLGSDKFGSVNNRKDTGNFYLSA